MADFNSKYTGEQVEALLDIVSQGGTGGGEGEVQKTTEAEITAMGFTKNLGTITEVKMNGVTKGTSGVVDLGAVITEHQEISISEDNNSGRPYLFIDTESVDGGLAIGVDATIDIADATEYGELADAYAVQKYVDDEIVHFETNVVEPLDIALSGKANYYIADFAVDDLTNIFYNGGRIENCNKQALGEAISNNSVILIKQSDDNGYCVATSTYCDSYELSFSVQDGSLNCSVATFMADPAIYQEEVVCKNLASQESVNEKQDQLVSGTNIKTINGQSLLGSGNITIEGGGGGSSSGGGMDTVVMDNYLIDYAEPNTIYVITTNGLGGGLEVCEFIPPTNGYAEYVFIFQVGVMDSGFSIPEYVMWPNGQLPDVVNSGDPSYGAVYELNISASLVDGGEYIYKAVLTHFKEAQW